MTGGIEMTPSCGNPRRALADAAPSTAADVAAGLAAPDANAALVNPDKKGEIDEVDATRVSKTDLSLTER